MNTDALYVADVSRDLIESPSHFSYWNFSKAPSFIDIVIYTSINLLVDDFNSISLFFIVQIIATIYITLKIYKLRFKSLHASVLTGLSIGMFIYLTLNEMYPFFLILKPAHHYSEFLVWLILSVMLINYSIKITRGYKVTFYLLCYFQCLSDQLIYIHFIIPASVFLLLKTLASKTNKMYFLNILIIILIIAAVAYLNSSILMQSTLNSGVALYASNHMSLDAQHLLKLIEKISNKSVLILVLNIVFYSIGLFLFLRKYTNKGWIVYFFISFVTTVVIILIDPSAKAIGRYFLPFFYSPIFFTLYFLPKHLSIKQIYLFNFLIILLLIQLYFVFSIRSWKFNYYPQYVKCVDTVINQYNEKNIIAGFWLARHYDYLTKKQLNFVPFTDTLSPDNRVMNTNKFVDKYSIILADEIEQFGLNKINVINQLGTPISIIDCKNTSVIIYKKNSLLLSNNQLKNNENN